jgi:hypothetical protein
MIGTRLEYRPREDDSHTSVHSTHSPLRPIHCHHLSGNFLMDAARNIRQLPLLASRWPQSTGSRRASWWWSGFLFDKDPLHGSRFPDDDLQSESVSSIPKDCLLHPSGSYQKDGSRALTSVASMWSVLKCDCAAVITSQPVFRVSPNHFSMTLVEPKGE